MDDATRFNLEPERDVETDGEGRYVATSSEPWLALTQFDSALAGAVVEITYRASLLDEPVRPVFRFHRDLAKFEDRIGAGPIVGAAIWIGRVPPRTLSLSVSPTNRSGIFCFRIERVRRRSWLDLISRGVFTAPSHAWRALALRLVGFAAESDAMLASMVAAFPMSRFEDWASSRRRDFDPDGLDRPRFDWRQCKIICIVQQADKRADLDHTCSSLRTQIFPTWSALLAEASTGECPADPRFEALASEALSAALADRTRAQPEACLVCILTAGDVVTPEAFMTVAEQAYRNPSDHVFYGDALITNHDGSPESQLAPGWNPPLERQRCFLRRPIFVRASLSVDRSAWTGFVRTGTPPESFLKGGARPLCRILAVHTTNPIPKALSHVLPTLGTNSREPITTIIIPTRDRPDLVKRVVASIRKKSRVGLFEIVIVNNSGSRENVEAALASLGAINDVSFCDAERAFNFSALCNVGAAASYGDILVFLNDDTEVLSDGWLDRLAYHATRPEVGAVGAKLTYPDGRLQHVGMVLGLGGTAGHFGTPDLGDAPGWALQNEVVHEVCAVTGACLAVTRSKFDAVGGFDAVDLPIELGDVDLCLKLRARGWLTLIDPDVHVMHTESASRGRATFKPFAVHAKERAIFCGRWHHILRDDPYFHPGLSLYSRHAALG